MMIRNFLILSVLAFAVVGCAPKKGQNQQPPHLPLEMTGEEYSRALTASTVRAGWFDSDEEDVLQTILEVGKRNLDWLRKINEGRPAAQKLSFSSSATLTGVPIEKPKRYSPEIIAGDYQKLMKDLPRVIKGVLTKDEEITAQVPIAEKEYLKWGLAVDKVYQFASRWLLMKPYLDGLAERRKADIRGYYFLSKLDNRQALLNKFDDLDSSQQDHFSEWLIGMCVNSGADQKSCQTLLADSINAHAVGAFYDKYEGFGKKAYERYFRIMPENRRSDVQWRAANPDEMKVPFRMLDSAAVLDFLKVNVEDEWKWGSWKLLLDFEPLAAIQVVFQPRSTPFVDGVGGNLITMDANAPLEEYDVRWTIRHEFGHTLGFPDCYVEFYDDQERVMINYQLDTSDLMCSRQGHLKERHFNDLKDAYFAK